MHYFSKTILKAFETWWVEENNHKTREKNLYEFGVLQLTEYVMVRIVVMMMKLLFIIVYKQIVVILAIQMLGSLRDM